MKVKDLKQKISQGEDMLILDVREAEEVAENTESVTGSQNMPMGKVFIEAKKDNLPRDKKIITVCKTGGRCEIVARELRGKGYDIEHLEGGIEAWQKDSG